MTHELVVATGQFPVTGQIAGNLAFILRLIAEAGRRGADIIHFPESSLSGYAGIDFPLIDRQQAPGLGQALNRVAEMAARSKIWVILGSHHFSDAADKPTNCLWLIDAHGAIVDRYDKRFLFGAPGEGEYAHYAAGHRPVTFTIRVPPLLLRVSAVASVISSLGRRPALKSSNCQWMSATCSREGPGRALPPT